MSLRIELEQNIQNEFDKTIKFISIGNSGVGKTTMLLEFLNKSQETKATIGIDFKCFYANKNDFRYKIYFWDTGGTERYHSISQSYIRDSNYVLIFFSYDNLKSFNELDYWINFLKRYSPDILKKKQFCFIGTKTDRPSQISKSLISELLQKYPVKLFNLTKFNNEQINNCFYEITNDTIDKIEIELKKDIPKVSITKPVNLTQTQTLQKGNFCVNFFKILFGG